ncbi:MAG TPA: hypothetical protein VIJ13_09555 [Actinomycetota bacterium]
MGAFRTPMLPDTAPTRSSAKQVAAWRTASGARTVSESMSTTSSPLPRRTASSWAARLPVLRSSSRTVQPRSPQRS